MQVTCMFYLIDATTKDVVEGGSAVAEQRPPWLGTHMVQLPFAFDGRVIRSILCS